MRLHFIFQVAALVPLIIGTSIGFASAQSPICHTFSDIGKETTLTDVDTSCADCKTSLGAQRCPPTKKQKRCGPKCCSKAPSVTMYQRYPYLALQMSYYARPYNAKYSALGITPAYSDGAFDAANSKVQSELSVEANLEYADAPQGFWPQK